MTTPQVLVTQSAQATVQVSPADPAVVEVLAPAVPVAVEVGVPGPQAPVRPPNELRVDTGTAGTVYAGRAVNGSAESSAAWTITRSTYNPAGVRQTKGTATGVTWTGRTGHTYS